MSRSFKRSAYVLAIAAASVIGGVTSALAMAPVFAFGFAVVASFMGGLS